MRTRNRELMDAILAWIDKIYFERGETPRLEEIAEEMGISLTSAHRYVKYLEEEGRLTYERGRHGVVTRAIAEAKGATVSIPIIGDIACGSPLFAEENVQGHLSVSAVLLGVGSYFALRAKGQSMTGAGIDDGDFVIVRKQNYADEGQIVVALLDDEATLKRYFWDRKKKCIRLHPENPRMHDILCEEVAVQGVAVKVIKGIR